MSSARSSVESWPLTCENDPEETYSEIHEDQPTPLSLLPPPPSFASLPANGNFFGIRVKISSFIRNEKSVHLKSFSQNDSYFRRRHGSVSYGEGSQRDLFLNLDEGSSLFEAASLLRSSPPLTSPPGIDEVQVVNLVL